MAVYDRTVLTSVFEVSHIVEISYRGIPGDQIIDKFILKDFWCLYYIDRGSVTFSMEDGSETELTGGEGLFFAPMTGFSHSRAGRAGAHILSVFFVCGGLEQEAFHGRVRRFDTFERMLLTELVSLGNTYFERFSILPEGPKGTKPREECPEYVPGLVKASLEFLLLRLYRRRQERSEPDRTPVQQTGMTVSAAVEYMYRNVDKKLKVEDIAGAVKMSQSNFQAVFRKATGQGVMGYFNQLKTEQAKIMIRKGIYTTGEIAAALGYSSESYFSRCFRKNTGMTPSEYARLVYYG